MISESGVKHTGRRVWLMSYVFFLVWNMCCTWWLVNATVTGAIVAFVANSFLMTIPFVLFHFTKKKFGNKIGYASLIVFWVCFEYVHQLWELAYPWLNLGNVFALFPQFIQWYSLTGVPGGTIWVLALNLLIFSETQRLAKTPPSVNNLPESLKLFFQLVKKPALLFLGPLVLSLIMFATYTEKGIPSEIVVLQPNIDPYERSTVAFNERYKLLDDFLAVTDSLVTDSTDYVVWPESAVPRYLRQHRLNTYPSVEKIRTYLKKEPQVSLVTGASTLKEYTALDTIPSTARSYTNNSERFFDSFNTAIQFDHEVEEPQMYYKSKLVPGTERMPYYWLMGFLDAFKIILDEDPIAGSLGIQKEREVFVKDDIKPAPVVCYESVFGEYVTEYINKGGNLIFIITNDAWWGNTNGHRHHLRYASLRAIENRRAIARSANTGVSCFIDQRGIIHQATAYKEKAVIRQTLLANEELTFYTKYGELLSRTSIPIAILLLLNLLVSKTTGNFRMRKN